MSNNTFISLVQAKENAYQAGKNGQKIDFSNINRFSDGEVTAIINRFRDGILESIPQNEMRDSPRDLIDEYGLGDQVPFAPSAGGLKRNISTEQVSVDCTDTAYIFNSFIL